MMPRCESRRPGGKLRCTREVAHTIHANCSVWWDDRGNCGREEAWPRVLPPLHPAAQTVTP